MSGEGMIPSAKIDQLEKADPFGGPKGPWTCFHCGDTFAAEREARLHFGMTEFDAPACLIKGSEGGLLKALRDTEAAVYQAQADLHSESAEALKAWQAAQSRHAAALVAMEQTGYERGMRDCRREIEILRRALAWHGDPQRMATTREEWQQEIDEAIRWVRDNPEEGRPSFARNPDLIDHVRA